VGAPGWLRGRVAEVLMQPHHALPHDDHFHVRVACPPGSGECIEWPINTSKKPSNALAKAKPPHGYEKGPKLPTKKLVRARSSGHVTIEAAGAT